MPPPHEEHAIGTIVNGQYRFDVRLAKDPDKDVLRLVDIWVSHHNDIAYDPVQRPAWATPYRTYMRYDTDHSYLWAEYRIDLTTPGLRTDGVYRLGYVVTDGALTVQCEYRIYMPYADVPTGTGEAVAVYYAKMDGTIYSNSLDFDAETLVPALSVSDVQDMALSEQQGILVYGAATPSNGKGGIYNILTEATTAVFGTSSVYGVAIAPSDGKIVWSETSGTVIGIQTSNLDGSGLTLLRAHASRGVCVGDDGYIYWTSPQGAPKTPLKRCRVDGSGYEILFGTAPDSPYGLGAAKIRIDVAAGLVFMGHWNQDNDRYEIWRYDMGDADPRATAVKMREWPYADPEYPAYALEIDRAAGKIYWSDPDGIKRANYDGTSEELLYNTTVRAMALAYTMLGS